MRPALRGDENDLAIARNLPVDTGEVVARTVHVGKPHAAQDVGVFVDGC